MRLCRYDVDGNQHVGFYDEHRILPLAAAAIATRTDVPISDDLLDYLPHGALRDSVLAVQSALPNLPEENLVEIGVSTADARLLVPVPNPSKLMLLAGNYSEHVEEGGEKAKERAETFPYVFMKPPLTTLTHPGDPIRIPAVSPDHVDWELELGVVIGRECKGVSEADALDYVAGYTVVNDVSDRKFQPNPNRAERPKNEFFDWLHGKWHDTFCPMGPCVLPADEVDDPQSLKLTLKVNGEVEQDSTTAAMIFPVAAIVEFVSSFVTLMPGDVISTGTPSGVGFPKGKFLKPGDTVEAEIERIGVLRNPVE